MEVFKQEATNNTPSVEMDHNNHLIEFSGDSRPENVQKFYAPVTEWLDAYGKHVFFVKDSQSSTLEITANFKLEYFNSSSAKYLMDIIVQLGDIAEPENVNLKINWYYEEMDEDMLEAGEEFQDMLDMPFNFIPMD